MADGSYTAEQGDTADAGLLSVADLCQMFEDSEEATQDARKLSERDRDYYDNEQLTDAEKKALARRGQPEVIINRIKRKIDFLVGVEKQQRVNPRATPRTPQHEDDADGATQGLIYVADKENFDHKRSQVWRNILVEGAGGMGVRVEPSRDGRGVEIRLQRVAWDRMFADPHSSEPDYSDAAYKGVVTWMDYADALAQYPEGRDALDVTMASAGNLSDTYDDKPKWRLWADKKRKRVRIVQIWIKRDDQWFFAEFTKGGILKAGPSPYQTDTGESDDEFVFQSAYVNRQNDRYGVVREMVSPQDEINKRRSKSLHLLNTAQIVTERGAWEGDLEALRKEAARPDGVILLNPGGSEKFKYETRTDLAAGHLGLLQEAKNEIDLMGPNATQMGDKAGGSAAASGKAIIASQTGGMIELGDLLDALRHFDVRVWRKIWYRIRQFWDAPKWIKVTDDEKNLRWVAFNVPPDQLEMLRAQNPQMAEKISASVGNVAELDCDITIEDAPDTVTPALEQWTALIELAKGGVPIPPDVLIEAAPNLKNKGKILERMSQPNPAQEQAQKIQIEGEAAKVEETKSKTIKNLADAHASQMPDMQPMPEPQQPEGPKPPSVSIAFKDMPPEAQAQALADAGIYATPDELRSYAMDQARQRAAERAAARPQQAA